MKIPARCGLMSLLLLAHPAFAEVFCVANGAQLQAALDIAAGNGTTDTIRLRSGLYQRTASLNAFTYSTSENTSLTLIGGWNAGCTVRDAGTATRIDGQDLRRPMSLRNFGPGNVAAFIVQGLTFEGGLAAENGGGLDVGGLADNTIHNFIEQCQFIANESGGAGGGLQATGMGSLRLRNSLFLANHANSSGAATLVANSGSAEINNNTVVANTADAGTQLTGGLRIGGSAPAYLANNIFALNEGHDLLVQTPVHERRHNTIEGLFTPVAAHVSGEINTAPEFMPGILNFNPRTGGAQYNGGDPAPPGGIGSEDLQGRPRVAGGRVDMGAYESAVLFYDGFDLHPAH